MPIVHLICGLPGSEKTTLARQLEQQGKGVRLSPDVGGISIRCRFRIAPDV
ncbi:AAA family ATPase [Methylocella sp.]|uniref:AAA family ATPase n=1 Tax=Methylocella sp. TaxID=1978226 RepID=UPI00378349D5